MACKYISIGIRRLPVLNRLTQQVSLEDVQVHFCSLKLMSEAVCTEICLEHLRRGIEDDSHTNNLCPVTHANWADCPWHVR